MSFIAMLFSACSSGNVRHNTVSMADSVNTLRSSCDTLFELPLPVVPEKLKTPSERADFVLLHFWDGMEFCDTLRSRNKAFMEQNFVNFVSLFSHASERSLPKAVRNLLLLASADSVAFALISGFADSYLYAKDSPMRCESHYIVYLKELCRLDNLSDDLRTRASYRLKEVEKNRVGTLASDFVYTSREGDVKTLRTTKCNRCLLLFYDPDCDHCKKTLDVLRCNERLNEIVKCGELTVLAVYADGDRELWDETKMSMPSNWMVGIETGRIMENALYAFPELPVIYLLDRDKTVLLKEASPAMLDVFLFGKE